jgi:hypothetical protein
MPTILKFWGWVKLNAMMLGIFAAVLAFCVAVSYFRGLSTGEAHGKAACEARYEKEKVQGFQAVSRRLVELNKRNAELVAQWEEQNRLTSAALGRKVENTYKVVEKIVEKPVVVRGSCHIDYAVVGMLNDAARGSTTGNRDPAAD